MRVQSRRRTLPTRVIALIVPIALLLVKSSFGAPSVKPDPDPGIPGEGFVDFVGNYGEAFKLRGGWRIDASMHGETEVINHSPSTRIGFSGSHESFRPEPGDFVPENFSRYALMQLVIMPRDVAPIKSLEELKSKKIRDLEASRVGFKVIERPVFGRLTGDWPTGTFEIWISTPYRLTQLYTASEGFLCILTAGRDQAPSTVIRDHYDWMRSGLRDWLVPPSGSPPGARVLSRSEIRAKGLSFRVYRRPAVWLGWALLSGVPILLAGVLGLLRRRGRARRACLFFGLFANAGAVLGGLIGLALWPMPWPSLHLPFASALACLLMPFLGPLAVRFGAGGQSRRALLGLTSWAVLCAGALSYASVGIVWGPDFTPVVPGNTAIAAFLLYGIGGILFALFERPPDVAAGARALATVACLMAAATVARAQAGPAERGGLQGIEAEIDSRARANLARRGTSAASLRADAKDSLAKTRALYDFQRVEIKGIIAKDNTNAAPRFSGMFDKQIVSAHSSKGVVGVPAWVRDINDLEKDKQQELSETAARVAEELKDREINEMVAHSWGTEIVYNLILTHAIRPPRRLIVAGMPDADLRKWEVLARYTGTEVVTYSNTHDLAAEAGRLDDPRRMNESAAAVVASPQGQGAISGEDILRHSRGDLEEIERRWADACGGTDGDACNPHGRTPKAPKDHPEYLSLSHSRFDYFDAMIKDHELPEKGDAWVLRRRQEAMISAEAGRLFESDLAREREAVKAEIEKQKEIARESSDRRLAATLRNIAARACEDPSSVQQSELESLPMVHDVNFYIIYGYGDLAGGSCAANLYATMAVALAHSNWFNVNNISRFVETFGPSPAPVPAPVAPAPLPAAPAPLPRRDPYEQARAFRDLAVKSCQPPGVVTQADFDRLGFFPTAGEVPGAADMAASLGGCARYVFNRMMEANRPGGRLDADMLTRWAREGQPPPPVRLPPHRGGDDDGPHVDPCRRFYGDYCNG